jgi:hypothetical protein
MPDMKRYQPGETRMNNGVEMMVVPWGSPSPAKWAVFQELQERDFGPENANACRHCDRWVKHAPSTAKCDCDSGHIWAPVTWVPILKLIDA